MIYFFYILAAVLVWFSYRSFRGGMEYLKYFQRELAKSLSDWTPFATIIAPCKGLDDGLERNLTSLLEQNYSDYEVIFVVDDQGDPAVSIISEVSCKVAQKTKLVVTVKAIESSQKVENLREAVLHADKRSEVFVFVDSDARPAADWLRHLIAPLADENVGAATGYRWFISKKPTFASEMRNMWNASIASALGPNSEGNFCWGGSTAIRQETFEKLNIRERWRGTLSDDFTVSRVMNEAGLKIHFVPQALTPSVENCSLREMFEFTNRQMKITRVYAPQLWLMSFFGSGLFNVVMITAFLIVIFSSQNSFAVWFSVATLVIVSIFSIVKSTLRLRAARLVLTDYASETRKQYFYQNVLWLFAPALFFANCIAALLSRRINWRGTIYEMLSPTETTATRDSKVSSS